MTWIRCLCEVNSLENKVNNIGNKARRLQKFLKLHPVCCFCLGTAKATTRDHLPPQSAFINNISPKGYIFPACEKCNNGSSEFDNVFAMISRFDPFSEQNPLIENESTKLIRAFLENHSDSLPKDLTTKEKRGWMKKANLEKAAGELYRDFPLVRVTPEINESIKKVSAKLIKALHYKHTAKIVPSEDSLKIRWWSNAQLMTGQFPSEMLDTVNLRPILKSGKSILNEQFTYGYQISEDGSLGMYVALFRKTFAVIGLVAFNPELLKTQENSQ